MYVGVRKKNLTLVLINSTNISMFKVAHVRNLFKVKDKDIAAACHSILQFFTYVCVSGGSFSEMLVFQKMLHTY